MRFSARTGNFAQSAKAVTRDFERSLDAARSFSPKSDEMVIAASNIKSKEKIAATKIKGEITSRGIRAAAAVKSDALNEEGKATLRKSKRKAGVLAAGGQMVADGANKLFQEDRTKRTVGEGAEGYTSLIEQSKKKAEELRTQAGNVDLTGGYKPMEVPSVGSSSGSSDTGSGTGSTLSPPKGVSSDISAQHSSKGPMSKAKIKQLAINAGFSPEAASTVVGIAGGESGFDPTNSTVRSGLHAKTGEDSVGLMQINWGYHKDKGWLQDLGITSREQLFDPATNLKAAKYLYDGRGGGFQDWTVYNKGLYQKYL